MFTQERKRLFFSSILFCVLLSAAVVLSTALSTEQVASALGLPTPNSGNSWAKGTTQPVGTTRAVFLPMAMKGGGTTTYAAFLSGAPTGLQIMGTGGLLGFGMLLGLFLLSEKPRWLGCDSKNP